MAREIHTQTAHYTAKSIPLRVTHNNVKANHVDPVIHLMSEEVPKLSSYKKVDSTQEWDLFKSKMGI